MSCPSKRISPETILPGGLGIRRMIERFVTDLPEPDSPTMPSVSPRSQVEADAVNRLDDAVLGLEVRPQVSDRKNGAVSTHKHEC